MTASRPHPGTALRATLNARGQEVPDPNPTTLPAGFKYPESLIETVRRLIRSESLSNYANSQEVDTFEEAEDFEIDDDSFDPSSPYEEVFDPVLQRGITQDEFKKNEAVYMKRFMEAEEQAYKAMDQSEALRARPRKTKDESPKGDSPKPPPTTKTE